MYCEYPLLPMYYPPKMVVAPPQIKPTPLFSALSEALRVNIKKFVPKAARAQKNIIRGPGEPFQQVARSQTIVIDCSSEEEQEIHIEIQRQDNKIRTQATQQSPANNADERKEKLKQGMLQVSTSEEIIPEPQQALRIATVSPKCPPPESQAQLTDFTIACPRMGIASRDLLARREQLLGRRISDWDEANQKGRKSKREIKNLGN